MINFLHTYLPQPILFQIGNLQVHWYGLLIVLGIVAGLAVVSKLVAKTDISRDEIYNLGFYLIIFSLLGARIYAVFLYLPFYLQNPFEIIAVWHGGLAIHGAIIGGVITLLIYTFPLTLTLSPKGARGNFWLWADLLAPVLALGQAIGRWGNYFNQEIFGLPTDLPWGIPIALANRPAGYLNFEHFQPTFLYESGLDLINFGLLIFLFFLVYGDIHKNTKTQKHKNKGLIFLVYLINYSLIRIGMEFLRIDSTPVVWGIRLPILVSLVVIIISICFLVIKNVKFENPNSQSNPKFK